MIILPEISYQEFCSILVTCFPEEQIDEQVFFNNIARHQFLFADHEKFVRGYLLFDLRTHPARLIQLCVNEGYRGLGIGSFLISHLKKRLLEAEISEIILNVDFENYNAIDFYQRHGFTKDSTNTQFTFNPIDLQRKTNSIVHIVKVDDEKLIRSTLDIGEFMTRYINQSSNNEVYVIQDKDERNVGHFLYNPEEIKISYFSMKNPKIVKELVSHFQSLNPSGQDLLLESSNREMDHYLELIPGMKTEYRLQIMKFCN